MRILTALFISTFLSFNLSANLAIQKITNDDFPSVHVNETAVIDGKLIFVAENKLAISDGTAAGTQFLTLNQQQITVNHGGMQQQGDYAVFINKNDNLLWRTNGQTFQQLSNIIIIEDTKLVKRNSLLFTSAYDDNNSSLIRVNGEQVDLLSELHFPDLDSLCSTSEKNLIVTTYNESDSTFQLTQYKDNSAIVLLSQPPENPLPNFLLSHDNNCFYKSNSRLIRINLSGTIEAISTPSDSESWDQLVTLKDRMYLYNGLGFYTLSNDSTVPELFHDASEDIGNGGFAVYKLEASNKYIYAGLTTPLASPAVPRTIIYDETFKILSDTSLSDIGKGSFPNIFPIEDDDFLVVGQGDETLASYLGYTQNDMYLSSPQVYIENIVGKNENIYAIASNDRFSGKSSLYRISSIPLVSRDMTGIWVDSNWSKQGLVISTGVRPDDSIYMFVSFYLYRDGQPFWVVGTQDIARGETSIEISLNEYTATSFLDDAQPEQQTIPFGTISLSPQGCHELNATITLESDQTINLNMNRIVDKSITGCSE